VEKRICGMQKETVKDKVMMTRKAEIIIEDESEWNGFVHQI
jgi:hypothetical protein